MSLWAEIKQRRITQIFVGYMAAGWMLLAVVDQFVDREILPNLFYTLGLTVYLFGAAAALVIGWYHGEKGAQKAPPGEIAALGLIAVACVAASVQIVRGALVEATLADALAETGDDLTRIGILYFEDMSPDGSIRPVADGITEGLITTLAEVRELEVTSRNAAREVRGLDLSPDSIAGILAVGTLVDGTVDQAGDDLRVTVRLLEGRSGVPLFRETYVWPVSEVASVSSELATEVGNALREQLGLEVRLREGRASAPSSAAWLQVARAEQTIEEANEALLRGDRQAMWDALEAAELELIDAHRTSPEWAEPLVLRSQVVSERSRFAESDEAALAVFAEAVQYADAALDLEPDNAAALERRGTALYRRWLLEAEDEDTMQRVLASAQEDLERALRLEPGRASASSTISHLYYQLDEWAQAVLAARQAYEEDAFLAVADDVLVRLYNASYDLDQYEEARSWCLEGRRRFPDDWRFVRCQIYVLTMARAEPDVSEAWALYEQMVSMMAEDAQSTLEQRTTETFIGGIIGRAGLLDSANAVMVRARVESDLDPSGGQQAFEAAMLSIMGDSDGALERLTRFMIEHPYHIPRLHWWWHNLQGDPAFERLQSQR
ncbi:MAG TPA: hypothetical protein VLA09_04640 [Longimicrobiales bacterium]|nr:hypothetical protein [Longimicrobiales bacterium]